jgi:hypothetical protein
MVVLKLLRFLAHIFLISQIACSNATVTITSLGAKFDGLSFDPSEAKVLAMNSFSVKGHCSPKVLRIYYKIDVNSAWKQIDGSNGTVDCITKGEFTINFSETIAKITASSGYTKKNGSVDAQIKIQVYGEAESYDTLEKTFTAFVSTSGRQIKDISATGRHELSGAGFKIKGHLVNSNFSQSLNGSTAKIRSANKELIK